MNTDSNSDRKERSFFSELSRRHVVASAVAYIIGSWVLIQVADVLGSAFGAPDWIVRAVTTVLLLLFPAFLVFSWEFNLTRKGFEHTEEDFDVGLSANPVFRRSLVGFVFALSLAAIGWTWQSGVLTDESSTEQNDEFPKFIAVDRFQTFAEDGSEWLGNGIANLVRDNLSQSRYLRVISLRRWQALADSAAEGDAVSLAAEAGIDFLVQGEIIGNRNGFVLTVRLTDTQRGEQLDGQTYEDDEIESLLERATSIAQNTRAQLKVPAQEQVDVYSADFAANNPSAYRAYTDALDYWINYEYSQSERLLNAAIALQPDFVMARYHLSRVLASQDKLDEAYELIEAPANNAEIREAGYINALKLLLDRDIDGSIEAYQSLIEEYPNDTELRWLLAAAHEVGYDSAGAASVFKTITQLEPEVQEGWFGLANNLIQIGEYDQAVPVLDKIFKLAPDNLNSFVLRGDLNRATQNLEGARDDYLQAISIVSEQQEAHVSLGQVQYLLGDVDGAIQTFDTLIRDTDAVPAFRMEAAFQAGGILNALGRYTDYIGYLELLEPEFVASGILYAKALSEKAIALMWDSGPTEDVARILASAIDESPGVPTRYVFARGLYELELENFDAVAETAEALRSYALPPDDPDRTEDRAADYLLGRAALVQGDIDGAIELLERANSVDGHAYRLYRLAHAEALRSASRDEEAKDIFESIVVIDDPVSPRLDLERDRQRARKALDSYVN